MSSKPGSKMFFSADPLLLRRVKSIIEDLELENPADITVVEHLHKKHREYLRKPHKPFLKSVGRALRHIQATKGIPPPSTPTIKQVETGGGTPDGEVPLKKRARNGTGTDSSDEELDDSIKLVPIKDNNSLNKGLTASYRAKARASESVAPTPKRRRRPREEATMSNRSSTTTSLRSSSRPTARFTDMAGIESCVQAVRELCEYPLLHPEIYSHLGVEPPRGILLHGPPGCGKTMLANAIAGELDVAFFKLAAPEVVSGMSGESEEKLRNLFEEAKSAAPSIIFIDEIDAITAKRESTSRGMEKRIVAQLLTCMDSLSERTSKPPKQVDSQQSTEPTTEDETPLVNSVIVIGATNHPDVLDPALRRAGRFDREISLGIPDVSARRKILEALSRKMKLSGDMDFKDLARRTPGYVGADLGALTKEAAAVAINRVHGQMFSTSVVDIAAQIAQKANIGDDCEMAQPDGAIPECNDDGALQSRERLTEEQLAPLCVTMADFVEATKRVQPSSKREGFATVPAVTWEDIGALNEARREMQMAIIAPIRNPEQFERLGLQVPAGVLLYGPPGCGKTLLAKAVANSSGANFISIKGPELLNKYVGESERAIRQLFARAQASSPCVIFFDELDALCPRRGSSSENGVNERVVNQLLTEMDGLESRRNVFVIAATNRPDIIDPAMLRPGRLDRLVYVPLPSPEDRPSILKTSVRNTPLADDVDLEKLAREASLDGFSGADLAALVREAAVQALMRGGFGQGVATGHAPQSEDRMDDDIKVTVDDFKCALKKVSPSVSKHDQLLYNRLRKKLRASRAHLEEDKDDSNNDDN